MTLSKFRFRSLVSTVIRLKKEIGFRYRLLRSPFRGYISIKSAGLKISGSVWSVTAGRVIFDYGVIVDSSERIIEEVSPDIGGNFQNHPAFQLRELPILQRKYASIGVASGHAHQVYYHWINDILPRLIAILNYLDEEDKIVVNANFGFQQETLTRLGINQRRIINAAPDLHVAAEKITVSLCADEYGKANLVACELARSLFLPRSSGGKSRRLYISRADAHSRRIVNERELFESLEKVGFDSVECSSMTVAEQARLFSEAKYVIGPHGASLTNLMFCAPGTKVIEIMPVGYINDCYQDISRMLSLDFSRIVASLASEGGSYDIRLSACEIFSVTSSIRFDASDSD